MWKNIITSSTNVEGGRLNKTYSSTNVKSGRKNLFPKILNVEDKNHSTQVKC